MKTEKIENPNLKIAARIQRGLDKREQAQKNAFSVFAYKEGNKWHSNLMAFPKAMTEAVGRYIQDNLTTLKNSKEKDKYQIPANLEIYHIGEWSTVSGKFKNLRPRLVGVVK